MSKAAPHPLPTSPPSSLNPAELATHLFLIRHGEVEAAYHRVFGGRIDMDLSPRGHEQARRTAEHLRPRRFDALFASPMKRAQQTLAPLAEHRRTRTATLDELREVDFGDWTGLNFLQVRERFGAHAWEWLDHIERGVVPHGENANDLRERIAPCLLRMLAGQEGKSLAVVCHGGVIRVMLSVLLDLPLSRMASFEIDYASVTWLEIQPHRIEVQLLNFTPWRDLA